MTGFAAAICGSLSGISMATRKQKILEDLEELQATCRNGTFPQLERTDFNDDTLIYRLLGRSLSFRRDRGLRTWWFRVPLRRDNLRRCFRWAVPKASGGHQNHWLLVVLQDLTTRRYRKSNANPYYDMRGVECIYKWLIIHCILYMIIQTLTIVKKCSAIDGRCVSGWRFRKLCLYGALCERDLITVIHTWHNIY